MVDATIAHRATAPDEVGVRSGRLPRHGQRHEVPDGVPCPGPCLARVDRRGQRRGRRRMPRGSEDGLRGREPSRPPCPSRARRPRRTTLPATEAPPAPAQDLAPTVEGDAHGALARAARGGPTARGAARRRARELRPGLSDCDREGAAGARGRRPVLRTVQARRRRPGAMRRRFPSSTAAGTAAFTLGRIVFEKQQDYYRAASWFETYLREQPNGPLMGDAFGRLMEARLRVRRRHPRPRHRASNTCAGSPADRTPRRRRVFCRGEPSERGVSGPAPIQVEMSALAGRRGGDRPFVRQPLRREPSRRHRQPMITRRVLLLADTPGDPFMDRIRAEIASLGLEVIVRAPAGIDRSERASGARGGGRPNASVAQRDRGVDGRRDVGTIVASSDDRRRGAGRAQPGCGRVADGRAAAHEFFPHTPPERRSVPSQLAPVVVQGRPAAIPTVRARLRGSVGLLYGAGGRQPSLAGVVFVTSYLWNRGLGVAFDVSAPIPSRHDERDPKARPMSARSSPASSCSRVSVPSETACSLPPGWARRSVAVLTKGHPSPDGGRPAGQQLFDRLHRPRLRAVTLDWKLSSWFGLGMSGLVGATIARVHVRFARQRCRRLGRARCWGRLCSARSPGTEPA